MKKFLFTIAVLLACMNVFSQRINKITLTDNGNANIITYALDEDVVLNISKEGNLVDWGVDRYAGRIDFMQRKLDPYTGRVEYYTENDNEAFRGKIKYIGKTLVTYFASFDNSVLVGRIKASETSNLNIIPILMM